MRLYNASSRKVEEFTPQNPANVKIYTCGPTVYSTQHIGNYAAYIYWDLLVRTISAQGWTPNRVLNLTDVGHLVSDADEGEDKLEKGAKREGKTVWEVAEFYADDFLANFRDLNLLEPAKITKATDYIEADTSLIEDLTSKGYTYKTTDGVYFDTSKFPRYPDFARLDLKGLQAGARVDFNAEKRNPSDFALWKFILPGEDHAMRWDYLDAPGYPGWHIECSSIIHAELGEPIDIHTGGIDHIPVHHTNEIAQSEAAFDRPLAKFWLHNSFITADGQKISKSLGNTYNFVDLRDKGFSHLDYKMWVLEGHYRSQRDFTFETLAAASRRLLGYRNFAALRHQNEAVAQVEGTALDHLTVDTAANIRKALSDNLNSPKALAALDSALPELAKNIWADPAFIEDLDRLFGLNLANSTPDISDELKNLIKDRESARKNKDYASADALRAQLEEQNITVLDTPSGPVWQLIK
jgi:cysteinyl-tRNA synthetase